MAPAKTLITKLSLLLPFISTAIAHDAAHADGHDALRPVWQSGSLCIPQYTATVTATATLYADGSLWPSAVYNHGGAPLGWHGDNDPKSSGNGGQGGKDPGKVDGQGWVKGANDASGIDWSRIVNGGSSPGIQYGNSGAHHSGYGQGSAVDNTPSGDDGKHNGAGPQRPGQYGAGGPAQSQPVPAYGNPKGGPDHDGEGYGGAKDNNGGKHHAMMMSLAVDTISAHLILD